MQTHQQSGTAFFLEGVSWGSISLDPSSSGIASGEFPFLNWEAEYAADGSATAVYGVADGVIEVLRLQDATTGCTVTCHDPLNHSSDFTQSRTGSDVVQYFPIVVSAQNSGLLATATSISTRESLLLRAAMEAESLGYLPYLILGKVSLDAMRICEDRGWRLKIVHDNSRFEAG